MNVDNIKYVLKQRGVIRDIAREHREDAKRAWNEARKAVHGIERVMDFEGFLLYAALLITLAEDAERTSREREEILRKESEEKMHKLEDVEKEREKIGHELHKALKDKSDLEQKIEDLEAELEKAREALNAAEESKPTQEEAAKESTRSEVPKQIEGWTVRKTKGGDYQLYRKIRGKEHSVTLGKDFDPEEARQKIAGKKEELKDAE